MSYLAVFLTLLISISFPTPAASADTWSPASLTPPPSFGAATTGGAGGNVIRVSSSSDSVSEPEVGSLRWALLQPGPRWIVFTQPMTITLAGPLSLPSNTTLDGRYAPVTITAPGRAGLKVQDVSNVIVESLTLRGFGNPELTDYNDPYDAILVQRASRVWIDHNSLSRAGDKLIGVSDGVTDLAITNNHFFQQEQVLQVGSQSTAANDVRSTVTIAGNWFDQVAYRMPAVSYGKAHVVNNYMDQWSQYGVRSERTAQVYLQANVMAAGASQKATLTTPGQDCNDAGTFCDTRPGYLYEDSNLFLGAVKVEKSPRETVFQPQDYYAYPVLPATVELASSIRDQAGPLMLASPPPLPPELSSPKLALKAQGTRCHRYLLAKSKQVPVVLRVELQRYSKTGWKRVESFRLRPQARVKLHPVKEGKYRLVSQARPGWTGAKSKAIYLSGQRCKAGLRG